MKKERNIVFYTKSWFKLGRFVILASLCFQIIACKKDKADIVHDNRMQTAAMKNSNTRLINLASFNQIIAGHDSLTNFVALNPNGPDPYKYPGTKYFPENGKFSKSWYVPQELFDLHEQVNLKLFDLNYQGYSNNPINFTAENSYQNPTDYYLLPNLRVEELPQVFPVKRGVSSPSRPDHFKIRIINLTGKMMDQSGNVTGRLEDLQGPVSLAYADGAKVNVQTNQVTTEKKVSEYIELPYGSYQFKVLTSDGRQIPAVSTGGDNVAYKFIDPSTSSLAIRLFESSNLVFAPIQYYAPGGVYTIVVSPRMFSYYTNEFDESVPVIQNGFDIITDVEPTANLSYCRVQGINAWDNQAITIKVNGQIVSEKLDFGKVGNYGNLLVGNHSIEVINASGKTIASSNYEMRAGQNYSIWINPSAKNDPQVLVVPNDLSGMNFKSSLQGFTQSAEDDGTYSRGVTRFPFSKRYLNLSSDNPYITFTHNNGQSLSNVRDGAPDANLRPAIPVERFPYLLTYFTSKPYDLMVYRSGPDRIPGTWANDIPYLTNQSFIANKDLYEGIGRKLPVHEPGYYTVALIGRSTANTASTLKARILIVKHNK